MSLTKAQRELRRYRVGASEIGALIDYYSPSPDGVRVDPHKTALDVFNDKVLPKDEPEVEDHRAWGTDVEAGILRNHARKTQLVLEPPPEPPKTATMVCDRYPMLCATPDGIGQTILRSRRVIEAKNCQWHQSHRWGAPGTDDAPLQYLAQVIVTIGVAAENGDVEDTGDLAAAIAGAPPVLYVIPFKEDLFGAFVEYAAKFVRDHLLTEKPPPLDGSRSSDEYVKRRFPAELPGKLIEPTEEILTLAQLVKTMRSSVKLAEKDQAEAETKLKLLIGDAAGVQGLCGWKKNKDTTATFTDWPTIAQVLAVQFNLPPQEATALVRAHTKTIVTKTGSRPLTFPKEK